MGWPSTVSRVTAMPGRTDKGMGTHYFQVQLQIGIPEVAAVAGRLLCLETTLYAPEGSGPRVPLASANVSVPFNLEGEVRLPKLLAGPAIGPVESHRLKHCR